MRVFPSDRSASSQAYTANFLDVSSSWALDTELFSPLQTRGSRFRDDVACCKRSKARVQDYKHSNMQSTVTLLFLQSV